MSEHGHGHGHGHEHHPAHGKHPARSSIYPWPRWVFLAAVAAMLLAMGLYVATMDEAVPPAADQAPAGPVMPADDAP